jgi:transcriptional regulator with XRE-family HTH domain
MRIRYLLKNYRLEKNYTQQHMAETLQMSRQQYSNIENGITNKISSENKQKLSELLDIPENLIENMHGVVYSAHDGNNYTANNDKNSIHTNTSDRLLESVIAQNKTLTVLLEKLLRKLS